MTPFQRILGSAFDTLPAPVRRLHALTELASTAGLAEIEAPANPGAWLLCKVAGLPRPGRDVPVTVSFHPDGKGGEVWKRRFARRRYTSTMQAATGRDAGLLVEHFGPFDLLFRLTPERERLSWSLAGWRLLGITLPAWSRPVIDCGESGDGDRFVFDIDVRFPAVGRVVRYRGWLALVND